MGFFSKVTDLHKNVKKLSLSHTLVKKIGGKKADAAYSGVGTAIGDAYTGGLVSKGKEFAYAKAAQEKAKDNAKKAKKRALLNAKKRARTARASLGAMLGTKSTMPVGSFGPKTQRNLELGGLAVDLGRQFAGDDSTFGGVLDAAGGFLGGFGGGDPGSGFLPEGPVAEGEPPERPSVLPFVLVGAAVIGALVLFR